MAKINHQDMRNVGGVSQTANKPQNYVVEDLSSQAQSPLDKRLSEFVEMPQQNVQQPQEEIKVASNKQLEKIIFMGRHFKEVDIAGHKFEICTITHRENNEIMSRIMNIGQASDLFTMRILTLAFAIKSVDGVKLENVDAGEEFDTKTDHNVAIIDNMQLGLVERLYDAYEKLVKESDSLIYGDAIKN